MIVLLRAQSRTFSPASFGKSVNNFFPPTSHPFCSTSCVEAVLGLFLYFFAVLVPQESFCKHNLALRPACACAPSSVLSAVLPQRIVDLLAVLVEAVLAHNGSFEPWLICDAVAHEVEDDLLIVCGSSSIFQEVQNIADGLGQPCIVQI